MNIKFLLIIFTITSFLAQDAVSACGANTRRWQADAGTTNWNTNNNWNPRNRPSSAGENALIVSDWRVPAYPNSNYTLGCLEVASGTMTVDVNRTLVIEGDYFRNINPNSISFGAATTWELRLSGTDTQELTNSDLLPRVRISNSSTVNITEKFDIRSRLLIDAGSGVININKGLTVLNSAEDVTIPSTATIVVKSGAVFQIDRNLTVDGVLRLEAGSTLKIGNGRTLNVGASGLLQIDGSPGSVASLDSISGTYNFNVAGQVFLDFFNISRMTTAGLNLTGTIQNISNGDFRYIATNGRAITLNGSSSIPTYISNIGFFDEGAAGTQFNIRANAYTGAVVTIEDYSGIGGTANESDPGNKLDWGVAAESALQVTDASPPGIPATTIAAGTNDSHIATFAFSMTAVAPASSDITFLKLTMAGDNIAADIDNIKVIKDVNGNCTYQPGTDTQIGGAIVPFGSPSTVSLTIPASEVSVIDNTQACLHILGSTNSTAQSGNTIRVRIASTDDVLNTEDYPWSNSGSPPIQAGSFTISGADTRIWNGGNNGSWTSNADWTPGSSPNNTLNCRIGPAYSAANFPNNTERSCQNINLVNNGQINWQNRTTNLSAYGSLSIGSGYTFTSAATGTLSMRGNSNQSINAQTNFPGNFLINKTGGLASLDSDLEIAGDFTVTNGNFSISPGVTLTILGDLNINGGNFQIAPGGTLKMGNGSVITVGAAGNLQIVGTPSQTSLITSINNTSPYTVVVDGSISANYYAFSNLGSTFGVSINAGATIDPTNHLQNGSFSYPVNNNSAQLNLRRQIPGNSLTNMVFDTNGSTATNVYSIYTNAAAGNLNVSEYSGDLSGEGTEIENGYIVDWGSETNTLNLTQQGTTPGSLNQGQTYNMGSFGFKQTQPGTFNNTDITRVVITLTGTADSSDISSARLYYDAACSGSGGTLLGTANFTGAPARATFNSLTGATVEFNATTPPTRCINVQVDIDSLATNGQTVGIKINTSADVTNSEGYLFNGAAAPTVDLGTPGTIIGSTTVWTGGNSTAWNNAGNWSSGIPNANLNCIINNAPNDPVITTAAVCKSLTNGNGIITIGGGGSLDLYGSFSNTGTFTQNNRVLRIRDNGATATAQTIKSVTALDSIVFNKTAGGNVQFSSGTLTINNQLSTGAANNFDLWLANGNNTVLNNGLQVNGATFQVNAGATLNIGSGQAINVNGGTFKVAGTNDAFPQTLSNKGKIQASSGRFGFNATSGNVNLVGFLIDDLNNNGLNFSSTVNITAIDGGQLRSLPTTFASVKAFQFNNSGTKPSLITNVGWNWDATPANTEPYLVAASTGCGGASISFDGWFGNWADNTPTFDTSTKVSNTSCNITLDGAASPVSLTSFDVVGYDSAVELKWTTGMEFEHEGFNVYRSNSPELGFVQINRKLIKNSLHSGSIHGSYVFHDLTAVNGETYYYLLEDISVGGNRKWHGPESATSMASAGTIPAAGSGDIFEQTNGQSGTPSTDDPSSTSPTPDTREIATNIQIISETSNALRLKITVPTYSLSASDQAGFSDLTIEGYSLTEVAGQAKLPYRTILIDLPDAASATYSIVNEVSSTDSGISIAPADEYVVSGNTIVAQDAYDSSYYANNALLPTSSIKLGTIAQTQGKTILPLTIQPIFYNPQASEVKAFTEIVVDIFLDGKTDWSQTQAGTSIWSIDGGLKIGIENKGIYKVTYDELVSSGTVYPFENANIFDLKLYLKELELPIKIESADATFNSGDAIIFYSPYFKSQYTKFTHLLLINDVGASDGLRVQDIFADPGVGSLSSAQGFKTKVHFEENLKAYFREPYSSDEDHILWKTFYSPPTNAGDDFFTHEVELNDLVQTGEIEVHALLKGGRIGGFNSLTHHVSLWVNDRETSASVTFLTDEPYNAIFKLDASNFVPGRNKIQFQAKATYIATTDLVDIDYFDIYYTKDWTSAGNSTDFESYDYDQNLMIEQLDGNNIHLFEISDITNIKNLTGISYTPSGAKFDAVFNQGSGRKFVFALDSLTESASTLSLTNGSNLHSTTNAANILYIGSADLLSAISPLAEFRYDEGYSYEKVDIQNIYNEFGKGEQSADAIKDFIKYAHENWEVKPQYVVLLGDSTFDPKGQLGSIPRNSIPLKLIKGRFYDYGSDNWYVSFDEISSDPSLSIGRIPGNHANQIANYAQKVINYETGAASNTVNFDKQIQLVIDKDEDGTSGEKFDEKADALKSSIMKLTPSAEVSDIRRSALTDAEVKSEIINAFDDGRSILHYLGHGAEDMWSGYDIFTNDEAGDLTNSNYPLVIAMNCLNSYFYYNDEEDKGLAEKLVLNPTGGAIAFWGSTSFTTPNAQNPFQTAFYNEMLSNDLTLGEAIKRAKITGGANGSSEVVNSWTLIGDPLLKIKILKKQVAPVTKAPESSAKSGGGCSVADRNTPWFYGLLEMLMAIGLIFGFKTRRD